MSFINLETMQKRKSVTLSKNLSLGNQLVRMLVLIQVALGFSIQRSFRHIDSMKTSLRELRCFLTGKTMD